MNTFNNTHGGDPKSFLKQFGFEGDTIYDFSVNTFPYEMPEKLVALLQKSIPTIPQYPDVHNSEFVNTVAKAENIPSQSIIPLNGSAQGMYALCSMPKVTSVMTMEPTFIEYKLAAGAYDKVWIPLQRNEVLNSDENHLNDIKDSSLIFVCNPNNPDGALLPKQKL